MSLRFLITNDDGLGSPGIGALARELGALGEVVVVAPSENQSAVARGITLRRALLVTEQAVEGASVAYALDGTPVDCVRFGVLGVGGRFDAVVSGSNMGYNLGDDVTYSGTVAAAFEALLLGLPAFAVSQGPLGGGLRSHGGSRYAFEAGARFAARLVVASLEQGFPEGTLYNVNVPAAPTGATVARLGRRVYRDDLELVEDRGRERIFRLYGAPDEAAEFEAGTDMAAVTSGRVAVTPLHFDLETRDPHGLLAGIDLDALL